MNEEDIKILENLKENVALFSGGWQPILKQEEKQAIQNLINRNKELEEIEESHRKENGELRERIKQLEDTNKKLYEIGKEIGKQHKYTSENYIPKSKVEEKIEELKQEGNYKTIENPNGRVHFQLEPCDYKIQVLEELLQEGE